VDVGLPPGVEPERVSDFLQVVGASNVDGSTVEVKVEGGGRDVLEIVRILDAEGVYPDTLSVREPTLDDVFLTLTGHRVDEKNGDQA